jgi:hypothetical protein
VPPRKRQTTTDQADSSQLPQPDLTGGPIESQVPVDSKPVDDLKPDWAAPLNILNEAHHILAERLESLERAQEIDATQAAARHAELSASLDTISAYFNDRIGSLEVGPPAQSRLSSRPQLRDTPAVGAIFTAMAGVMDDVQGVGKRGLMAPEGGGYAFRKYDDLKRELGAAVRRHGVGLQARVLGRERTQQGRMTFVTVEMQYRFTSLLDGSEMIFEAIGEGSSTGDKASGKAMTMALKSTLDQAFMLAMEDIEDPDATFEEPEQFIHTRGPQEGQPIANQSPKQEQRNQSWAQHDRQPEYAVGDKVAVAGQTFVKHSEGPALGDSGGPSYPNSAPKDTANPWDQGPPKDQRTPAQLAQAAAEKLSNPRLTMGEWSAITDHARKLEIMDVLVTPPDGTEIELKRYAVAVARTLPS